MAPINCPECNREVSDKAASCPNCGLPIKSAGDSSSVIQKDGSSSKAKLKIRLPFLAIGIISLIAIAIYIFTIAMPNARLENNYARAMILIGQGRYDEAMRLLDELGEYKDASKVIEYAKYEAMAFDCINELKRDLEFTDSFVLYEVNFYLLQEDAPDDAFNAYMKDNPSVVVHYGGQNWLGETATEYALFAYTQEHNNYALIGTTRNLTGEGLSHDEHIIAFMIKMAQLCDNVGIIDMERLKMVSEGG